MDSVEVIEALFSHVHSTESQSYARTVNDVVVGAFKPTLSGA